MKKVVFLDMDGTIADLYGVNGWLEKLESSQRGLFSNLRPLISSDHLKEELSDYDDVVVVSMTPTYATKEYINIVAQEKVDWLHRYFPWIKHILIIEQHDNKNLEDYECVVSTCPKHLLKVYPTTTLIDDNAKFLDNFKGVSMQPPWLCQNLNSNARSQHEACNYIGQPV